MMIMKKMIVTLLLMVGAGVPSMARVFVGGTGGVGYVNDAFRWVMKPGVGYEFNERWAIGTTLGFSLADSEIAGVADPFVRFNCWNNGKFFIDAKAHAEMIFRSELGGAAVGVSPSVRYEFSPRWQVAASVGLLGAQYDGYDWSPAFMVTGSTELGIIYRF